MREPDADRQRYPAGIGAVRQPFPDGLLKVGDTVRVEIEGVGTLENTVVAEPEGFVVEVADRGIGIPRAEQAKVFEKFYRVGNGMVHDVKGSGLGLSLVKHIIEAHKGTISVESDVGKGSRFTILLPLARKPAEVGET